MEKLSKDPMFIILNKLNDKDLVNYCQVNKKAFEACNNQIFWFNRIKEKFPYIPLDVLNKYREKLKYNWTDYYIKDLRKINLTDKKDINSLLNVSSEKGRLDHIMIALNNGADIHFNSDDPVIMASLHGHLDVVKYLEKKGADIHADNNYALVMASGGGHLDVVRYLVENNADVQAQSNGPFLWAGKYGHLNVIKYLVEKGADVHANYDMVLMMARRSGHSKIVEYLESLKTL